MDDETDCEETIVDKLNSMLKQFDEGENSVIEKEQVVELMKIITNKFENDRNYQSSLETQLDALAEDCRHKEVEIERLSADAQDAINDCRRQAEAMAENMFSKISLEMNNRASMEKLVGRLQRDLTSAQSELRLHQIIVNNMDMKESVDILRANDRELRANGELKKKLFLVQQQLADAKCELQASRLNRDREMEVVALLASQLNNRAQGLEAKTGDIMSKLGKTDNFLKQNSNSSGTDSTSLGKEPNCDVRTEDDISCEENTES